MHLVIVRPHPGDGILSKAAKDDCIHEFICLLLEQRYRGAIVKFADNDNGRIEFSRRAGVRGGWVVVSDGRYATDLDLPMTLKKLEANGIECAAVNVMQTAYERIRLGEGGKVAGFSRSYPGILRKSESVGDWPCHLFLKRQIIKEAVGDVFEGGWVNFCGLLRQAAVRVEYFEYAGKVLDLDSEAGLLELIADEDKDIGRRFFRRRDSTAGPALSGFVRIHGKVLVGEGVQIEKGSAIVGPAVLCDRVRVGQGAVVDHSVVGTSAEVGSGKVVRGRVLTAGERTQTEVEDGQVELETKTTEGSAAQESMGPGKFKQWPKFSYARFGKWLADVVTAMVILILFLPVFAFVALAVKLTSPGPVLFGHKREGLRGKEFFCLKFRTMVTGADDIQEKLRLHNKVDGPQFKMDEDPRITTIGKFLRNTYVDELPQFWNVLRGEMSVVGPRPSPRHENSLCASWRDARLSVKPGVTGLWQVCRTRKKGQDFQEYIRYDTEYVQKVSVWLDLWICWKTVEKVGKSLLEQF